MFIYWLMYIIPASLAMLFIGGKKHQNLMLWLIICSVFIILIGFRHEVGSDWFSYLYHYQRVVGVNLNQAVIQGDPGYVFLNWLMARWGWGVYGVNLVSAIIFIVGLAVFCRQQEKSWLAFSVAVPYLMIAVVMGYTRQGIAIGLFFWAIAYLERGKLKYYLALLVIATLFHKTAVLMIPLGIFLYVGAEVAIGSYLVN